MRIACLHSAESNIEVFEAALRSLDRSDVTLGHEVRADLLAAAERQGGVNAEITAQARAALLALSATADAVLLTCSTLGEAAGGDFARKQLSRRQIAAVLTRFRQHGRPGAFGGLAVQDFETVRQ